ncbi:MAG: hypothetical protein KJ051_06505 [Thermoleophilia bacterium]|nr:hypothetical protein [Thermoleophilia bacterium]
MSAALATRRGSRLQPLEALFEALVERTLILTSEQGAALLVKAGPVGELFLTLSSLLVGRSDDEQRLGLLEGEDVLSRGPTAGTLLSLCRSGSRVFLRYKLPAYGAGAP